MLLDDFKQLDFNVRPNRIQMMSKTNGNVGLFFEIVNI